MIVKINIVKAAKVLTQKAIEHYYVDLNKNKSKEEIEDIIYIVKEVPVYFDKKNNEIENPKEEDIPNLEKRIFRQRLDFQETVKKQAEMLYQQYFNTLKDIKNYN
jgi:glutaredoxin